MSKYRLVSNKNILKVEARWLNPFFALDNSIGPIKVLLSYVWWINIKDHKTSIQTLKDFVKRLERDEQILIEDIKSCFSKEKDVIEYLEDNKKDK